jgi:hypothetical protein
MTASAWLQALDSGLSSGWPTSIHSRLRPVKSISEASGSSGSDRPAPKARVPSPPQVSFNSCACSAIATSRTIMRSSVSLGWRARVSAWSA